MHIHGHEDDIVPLALVAQYAAAAVQAGDQATLESLPGAGHFELVDACTAAGQRVVDVCVRLTT